MSASTATAVDGLPRGRRKYVAAMDGGVPQLQEHIAADVGSLLAIHGSQRPAKGHPHPWLPRHEFDNGWLE